MNWMHAARTPRLTRPLAALAVVGGTLVAGALTTAPAVAAPCSDVDVVFARGTGERPGLGFIGTPFVRELTARLAGRSVSTYAVDYAANTSQSSAGPGATDMSRHIREVAASCPSTRFVIGGYSQGATVTDIAVGIRTGSTSGTPIAAQDAPRVAAVVVFGNPLGLSRRTIASASPTYGARSRDYCGTSDGVCGRYQPNVTGGHISYASNGATSAGAAFAADLVGAATPGQPPTADCVTASTSAHLAANRATSFFGRAYAVGSRDALGTVSSTNIVSLRQTAASTWNRVDGC